MRQLVQKTKPQAIIRREERRLCLDCPCENSDCQERECFVFRVSCFVFFELLSAAIRSTLFLPLLYSLYKALSCARITLVHVYTHSPLIYTDSHYCCSNVLYRCFRMTFDGLRSEKCRDNEHFYGKFLLDFYISVYGNT